MRIWSIGTTRWSVRWHQVAFVLFLLSGMAAAPAAPSASGGAQGATSGDEPVITPLPEKVVDRWMYVTGISRSHQALRIYHQGTLEVETRSNEGGDFAVGVLLEPGQNEIQVVAVDFGRETERSNAVMVEYLPRAEPVAASEIAPASVPVINAPSAPVLDAPATPATSNPITVTGTAGTGTTVRFFVNGVYAQSGLTDASGHFSLHVPIEDGANTLYAIAEDGSGQSPASNTVAVSYTNAVSRTQGGTLTQDTAWTKGDGTPYTITSNLTVPAGKTLWLEPGVTLKFGASLKLLVQGSLIIRGTAGNYVQLTSAQTTPTRGYWTGLEFSTTATTISADYAQIEYASRGTNFNGTPAGVGLIMHSLIRNNSTGIYVAAPTASPTITNGNEITANQYGMYVLGNGNAAQNPTPVLTANSIHDNVNSGSTIYDYYATSFGNPGATVLNATGNWWGTSDPLVIGTHIYDWSDSPTSGPVVNYGAYLGSLGGSPAYGGATLDGVITSNTTLSAQEYQVLGTIEVAAGVTLTIPAGAVLKFVGNFTLRVKGSLQVTGTAAQRVVFTSARSTPARNDWLGIEITATATSVSMDYAQIEYANKGLNFNGSAAGVGLITHTLIRNNAYGVYIAAPNASPTISNGNEVTTNQYGFYLSGNNNATQNPLPVITGNSIHDNVYSGSTIYDIYAVNFGDPGTTIVNATGNWWGTADPVLVATHLFDWTDNISCPVVNYAGYLDSLGGAPIFSGPTLDGQLVASATLSAQEYQVLGNVEIAAGVTLTIPAGAALKFVGNYVLRVKGSLQANATSAQRVLFTSGRPAPARNDWAGIEITSTAAAVAVDYAQIEYANRGLYFNGSAAGVGSVTHSLIRNNTYGISVIAPSAAPAITAANEITANLYGVYVSGNGTVAQNPAPVVAGNSIHDNVNNGTTIYDYYAYNFGNPGSTALNATGNWWGTTDPTAIAAHIYDWTDNASSPVVSYASYLGAAGGSPVYTGPTLQGQIGTNTTLTAQEYQVLGTVEVVAGTTLTAPAGASLKFLGNYTLRINGSLQVTGSASQPVVFTSGRATPALNDWAGIEITSTASNVAIDYARVEYANKGLWFRGSAPGIGLITHTLVRNNTYGIRVEAPSAAPRITSGNEITANQYGLYVLGNSNAAQNPMPVVSGNSIHDNIVSGSTVYDYYSVSFGSPATTFLNTTGNWWGTAVYAQIATHVYDQIDNSSSPYVGIDGYLSSATQTPPTVVAYGTLVDAWEAKPLQGISASGSFLLTAPGTVRQEIHRESDDAVVYARTDAYASAGQLPFVWDGKDGAGQMQTVGLYRLVLVATDGTTSATSDAPLGGPAAGGVSGTVPSTYDPFRNRFFKVNVTVGSPSIVSMQVTPPTPATPFYSIANAYYPAGPNWLYWDGRDPSGQILTQAVSTYFPVSAKLRRTALRVTGTQPVITGQGSAPDIEVKSDPYLITHSYEEISTLVYRIDLDAYVTVKLLPPGIYDPANAAAIVVINNQLQQARDGGGVPIDHVAEWRGYDTAHTNHIATADEGIFTFTIEARSQQTNVTTLYRGVLQLRR